MTHMKFESKGFSLEILSTCDRALISLAWSILHSYIPNIRLLLCLEAQCPVVSIYTITSSNTFSIVSSHIPLSTLQQSVLYSPVEFIYITTRSGCTRKCPDVASPQRLHSVLQYLLHSVQLYLTVFSFMYSTVFNSPTPHC